MMSLLRAACAALVLGLAAGAALAAGNPDAQNPAPINALEIDAGKAFNRGDGEKDESWVRLSYKGTLVREAGTPVLNASPLALLAPALPADAAAGDRNRWSLRYERGAAGVNGGLFEALGVQPVLLRGLESLELRGTAGIAGDNDGKNLSVAIGVESPPWRLPGLARTEVSNWLVLGLNAERNKSEAEGETVNRAVVTYRAFAGKAFGWRKSADPLKVAAKLERDMLELAKTRADALALAEKLKQITAAGRTSLQQLLLDAIPEAADDAGWAKAVREIAVGQAEASTDQPTLAVYAESTGWYRASGNDGSAERFRNLFNVTLDYWFLAQRDDMFLRLRYENGYEWAAPERKLNRLLASVALRF